MNLDDKRQGICRREPSLLAPWQCWHHFVSTTAFLRGNFLISNLLGRRGVFHEPASSHSSPPLLGVVFSDAAGGQEESGTVQVSNSIPPASDNLKSKRQRITPKIRKTQNQRKETINPISRGQKSKLRVLSGFCSHHVLMESF